MNRKELFAKLKAEEQQTIASKTASVKFADSCIVPATITTVIKTKEVSTKAVKAEDTSEDLTDEDSILVKVVANTANFIDSHMDVLSFDAYSESIANKGNSIPHIADHKWEAASDIGDVQKVYTQEVSLKELGLDQEGATTALIFETLVKKSYNEKIFNGYKDGRVKQHSISLKYKALKLALDSPEPEDTSYKETWDAYYPSIVNKEVADAKGYFWAVPKIDIIENSAVLFGANSLTPTLELTSKAFALQDELPTQTALVEQGENTMTLDEALKRISDLETEIKQVSATATKAERERTVGMLEAAKTFSQDTDTAIKAINKAKWEVEDAIDFFTSVKAAKDTNTSVDTSVVPFGKAPTIAAGAATTVSKTVELNPSTLFGESDGK